MDERKRLGDRGEEAVARWLRGKGYRLLASQYRCRFGEIDLIARSRETIKEGRAAQMRKKAGR